jgi:hypothetical protein
MKMEGGEETSVEIGGQDADRQFKTETLKLPPGKRVQVSGKWHTVSYLSVGSLLPSRVGIHSPALDETYLIPPHEWSNIWVYGMDIFLAGHITRAEFRRRARRIPMGSRVFQYPRTCTDNMAVPVSSLHSLSDLFVRAKNWAEKTGR